jgi:hypothetical protein
VEQAGLHANIPHVGQASAQNERINTTKLSKEKKRLLDVEEDNETRPRKQTKNGYVAFNNQDDPAYSPSEGSESEGGDINPGGDMGLSPTARHLRNTPRKQLNNTVAGSASTLKRPSKITKLQFTSRRGARDSTSTTLASPDPRTLHKEKKSSEATKTASTSSHPTLPASPSPEKAAATNSSIISSGVASPVQRTHSSLSPVINRSSAQNPQPTTDEHSPSGPEQENPQPATKEHSPSQPEQENPQPATKEHSPSQPEQEMAPRPYTPHGATTAPMDAGNYPGYPPMQQSALILYQAAIALRDFPIEHARATQLEDANENLQMEIQKLKEKEAELKQKIGELNVSNNHLEGALKNHADQVKKLEAALKEMSEKKNRAAHNSANGATNPDCDNCLEHVTRINALTEENEKIKQRIKLVAEEFVASNDQA